jgi:hypothetical protein
MMRRIDQTHVLLPPDLGEVVMIDVDFAAPRRSLRRAPVASRRDMLGGWLAALAAVILPVHGEADKGGPARRILHRQEQRRQKRHAELRRRRHEQRNSDGPSDPQPNQLGISFLLRNPSTSRVTIHVDAGELNFFYSCNRLAVFDIPPGTERLFDTSSSTAYAWIANRYYLEFENPIIGRPWVHAGYDGSGFTLPPNHCYRGGTLVLHERTLSEGNTVSTNLAGHTFTIRRNEDKSNFKYFTIDLAATL